MTSVSNPWLDLPTSGELVAPCDRAVLNGMPAASREKLKLHLLPAPYAGVREAPVLFLLLNPGHKDVADPEQAPGTPFYMQQRAALSFEGPNPNYLLSGEFEGQVAYAWYARTLAGVLRVFDPDVVARRLLLVQLFPYRSEGKIPSLPRLPSQDFTFQIVRDAMARGAQIVIGRSKKEWVQALPELCDYQYIMSRNVRNPTMSQGNLGAESFRRVVAALRG